MIPIHQIIWAIFIGDLLILAFHVLFRHTNLLMRSGVAVFILGSLLSALRACAPFEPIRVLHIFEFPVALQQSFPSQNFLQQHRSGVLLLILIWLAVSLLLILQFVHRILGWEASLTAHYETDVEATAILKEIDPDCPLPVRRTVLVDNPVLVGYIHMAIYLPYSSYSVDDLKNILLHEYTHWKHHHSQIKLFIHLSTLFMWWNPFIHIFKRDFSHLLELLCDEITMSHHSNDRQVNYFSTIFRCMQKEDQYTHQRSIEEDVMPHLVSMGKRPLILQRFEYLIQQERRVGHAAHVLSCLGITCFFLLTYCIVVQPAYTPEQAYGMDPSTYSNEDNSFLVEAEDGSYSFHYDSVEYEVDQEDIKNGYYCIYPVIPYKEYADSGDYTQSKTYRKYFSHPE